MDAAITNGATAFVAIVKVPIVLAQRGGSCIGSEVSLMYYGPVSSSINNDMPILVITGKSIQC